MLLTEAELSIGVFDSSVLRGGQTKSQERKVECFELELFHNDGGTSHINGKAYPARRGMLLCAKPNSIRYSDFPVRCSFIRLFHAKGRTEDIEAILSSLPDCMYIDDINAIEKLLSLFSKSISYLISSSFDTHALLKLNSTFLEILSYYKYLYQKPDQTSSKQQMSQPIYKVYEYINEHFTSDCSLKALAETVNLSPNHLHIIFKKNVGITPYEYVLSKRIDWTKKLIIAGEKSMLEIALETGFCSQSHFNKVFKEQTGVTPTEFRKQLWDRY